MKTFKSFSLLLALLALACNKPGNEDPGDKPGNNPEPPAQELPAEIPVTLSTVQKATAGSADGTCLKYTDYDGLGNLYPLCSQLSFTLSEANITAIDIWAAAGEQMTGEFTLRTSDMAIILEDISGGRESKEDKGPVDKITLSNGGNAIGTGKFIATVLPATYSAGVCIKLTRNDGKASMIFKKSSISATAGNITDLGTITATKWEAATVPMMFITLTGNLNQTELTEKSTYLKNYVHVEGCGVADVNNPGKTYISTGASGQIKGRGNSTWGLPKKPYRLKMDRKVKFCNFGKAKSYVLLADFIDATHMLNATAFKAAKILGMEYSNTAVPVDVWINGTYKGAYCLTEQVEIGENRLNIPKANGIMLELDTNYDEDCKFYSSPFNLPTMLKDPDEAIPTFYSAWQPDFNSALSRLQSDASAQGFDVTSAAQYLLVYNLMDNMEVNHPKSAYLHKTEGGLWTFGPIWDFDWSCDFEATYASGGPLTHFKSATHVLLGENMTGKTGYTFFRRLLDNSRIVAEYDRLWGEFKTAGMTELNAYIDSYAAMLRESALKDGALWDSKRGPASSNAMGYNMDEKSSEFDTRVAKLKTWLGNRVDFMTNEISTSHRCGK